MLGALVGLIGGTSSIELPGVLIDLSTFEPLAFQINPNEMERTKSLICEDHIIPGRHAPLQEPVAGGAERLTLDLLFLGSGAAAMIATKQAVHWLESLMYPDTGGGLLGAVGNLPSAVENLFSEGPTQPVVVAEMGHRVNLTFGTWILEQQYLLREISVRTGPGHDPFTLMPYRAMVSLTLQEDELGQVDYIEHRWGVI